MRLRAFGATANAVSLGATAGPPRLVTLVARSVATVDAPVAVDEPLFRRSLSRLRTLLLRFTEPESPSTTLPFGVVVGSLETMLLKVELCLMLLTGSATSATGVLSLSSDGVVYAAETARFASKSSTLASASSRRIAEALRPSSRPGPAGSFSFDSVSIPKWLSFKSPAPNVSTANCFFGGPGAPTPVDSDSLSVEMGFSCSVSSVPDRLLVWVLSVLVMVFAAFCAAETKVAKKPPPEVALLGSDLDEADFASSIVGVSGADIAFDSLLGLCNDPDSERTCRCVIVLPDVLTDIPPASLGSPEELEALTGDPGAEGREPTGVGGVTVVTGVFNRPPGGVCGLSSILRGGRPGLEILARLDWLVFASARTTSEAWLSDCASTRDSVASVSASCTSVPLLRNDPLSGLIFEPPGDFPGWNASLNFRLGEMLRNDLLMLFLGPDWDSDGGPKVFARSNKVGEAWVVVELGRGSVGERFTEGILDELVVGLCTSSSDDSGFFSSA